MLVLVVNCGSSSVKLDLLETSDGERVRSARVERVGRDDCCCRSGDQVRQLPGADHGVALEAVLPSLIEGLDVRAVGHRVVHGGGRVDAPVRVDEQVLQLIEELVPLAPLHNPANLAGLRAARSLLPDRIHVAVFDTAFHGTLPRRAQSYALPRELAEKHSIRRYGFHGPSHRWVAEQAARELRSDIRDLRLITCHLGNGASVTAVEHGRSVETSMGK